MNDDTIESLRVKLAEVEKVATLAEVQREGMQFERDAIEQRWADTRAKLDQALAACAEMRAALEKTQAVFNSYGVPAMRRDAEMAVNAILARTDLGRGMVAVPRGVVERIGKYAREDRMVTPGSTRLARLLADLDALLDGGKAKP